MAGTIYTFLTGTLTRWVLGSAMIRVLGKFNRYILSSEPPPRRQEEALPSQSASPARLAATLLVSATECESHRARRRAAAFTTLCRRQWRPRTGVAVQPLCRSDRMTVSVTLAVMAVMLRVTVPELRWHHRSPILDCLVYANLLRQSSLGHFPGSQRRRLRCHIESWQPFP